MAHALLSASGSDRWLHCPPSAKLEAKVPDQGSVFAAEGTLAHSLGELALRKALGDIADRDYITALKGITGHELYSAEMPEHINRYTDYVLETLTEAKDRDPGAVIFLEQRLDFSHWVPGGFGTGDVIILADGTMEVIDLKYGKGVAVEAEDNSQMKLYGLGALDQFGFIYTVDKVRMTIHQPRLDAVSSWEISAAELLKWADEELAPKAKLAWAGKGEPAAGDWCRFCKVKARCRARAEAMQAVAGAFGLKAPNLLSVEDIAAILLQADEIQAWAKDVQDFALEQARDHGIRFAGWKLVEGRSNRKYADEPAVEAKLLAEGYPETDIHQEPKLLGITAMEKLLGKPRFESLLNDLVVKPAGQPALVPESDKRPEHNSAASDFDI